VRVLVFGGDGSALLIGGSDVSGGGVVCVVCGVVAFVVGPVWWVVVTGGLLGACAPLVCMRACVRVLGRSVFGAVVFCVSTVSSRSIDLGVGSVPVRSPSFMRISSSSRETVRMPCFSSGSGGVGVR